MNQLVNTVTGEGFAEAADGALEMRVWRSMIACVVLAALAGMLVAPWRVTSGLLLGGALALLNYHWLRTSVAAVFRVGDGERPQVKISRYFLRYLVVGVTAFAAYKLRLVSLAAMFAGLCSFVPALFVEALRQFYFAIIHREESF